MPQRERLRTVRVRLYERVRLDGYNGNGSYNGNGHGGARVRIKKSPRHDNVILVDLEARECRWSVGLTKDILQQHVFCGRPTQLGRVYCDAHHARAHAKPLPRKGESYRGQQVQK